MKKYVYPKDFVFGVASSAHQIEGSPLANGSGKSVWYTFSHTHGNIKDSSTIDITCDHYNKWKEDIFLLKQLGVDAYRFSIAWTRIIPNGYGKINKKGIDFYNKIIDELLKNNILPVVTIHHWELPVGLQYQGGWLNDKIVDWFLEYSHVLFENFADRVKLWITLNEPIVTVLLGYLLGIYPPAMRDINMAFKCVYNLVRAHGQTVYLFKKTMNIKNAEIGIAVNCMPIYPATRKKIDIEAAKRLHSFQNELILDLIFLGKYPKKIIELFKDNIVVLSQEDKKIITAPFDFVGLNYYTRFIVKHTDKDEFLNCHYVKSKRKYTKMGWEIYPEGLYELISWISKKYKPKKIYITENGASFEDKISNGNLVNDYERIKFLQEHIKYLTKAVRKYSNVKGYFVWSFLDNFEWTEGFTQRFGLVYVDYSTQRRIIKKSGFWYKKFIEENKRSVL